MPEDTATHKVMYVYKAKKGDNTVSIVFTKKDYFNLVYKTFDKEEFDKIKSDLTEFTYTINRFGTYDSARHNRQLSFFENTDFFVHKKYYQVTLLNNPW